MTSYAAADGFIPVRKRQLLAAMTSAPGAPDGICDVLCLLAALLHHERHTTLEALKGLYDPLDPDAPHPRRDTRPQSFAAFEAALKDVLVAANFTELAPDAVDKSAATKLLTGLQIKASSAGIRAIRFFARGAHSEQIEVKTWFGLRRKSITVTVMTDVVVLVSFKSDDEILREDKNAFADMRRGVRPGAGLIKYFRNVAGPELVTLHPGAKPAMRPRDQVFLAGPALAGGLPVLLNLWPALTVLFAVLAAYFGMGGHIEDSDLKRALAAISGLVAVGAFVGRQWMKYERQTLKYQKQLADTIYFRNIANNAGVLDLLIGAGEEQDVKEALIAYWVLLEAKASLSEAEIDARAEAFLRDHFDVAINFDAADALAKLTRMGLARDRAGAYAATPVSEARAALDTAWDGLFRFAAP